MGSFWYELAVHSIQFAVKCCTETERSRSRSKEKLIFDFDHSYFHHVVFSNQKLRTNGFVTIELCCSAQQSLVLSL